MIRYGTLYSARFRDSEAAAGPAGNRATLPSEGAVAVTLTVTSTVTSTVNRDQHRDRHRSQHRDQRPRGPPSPLPPPTVVPLTAGRGGGGPAMPSLCGEAAGLAEALLRAVADAADAGAEAWLEAQARGAAAALGRADVAQLLRTDPLYPAPGGRPGAGGRAAAAVGPEEMEAYFAVRERGRALSRSLSL